MCFGLDNWHGRLNFPTMYRSELIYMFEMETDVTQMTWVLCINIISMMDRQEDHWLEGSSHTSVWLDPSNQTTLPPGWTVVSKNSKGPRWETTPAQHILRTGTSIFFQFLHLFRFGITYMRNQFYMLLCAVKFEFA